MSDIQDEITFEYSNYDESNRDVLLAIYKVGEILGPSKAVKLFENEILDTNDPDLCEKFCKSYPKYAHILEHGRVIIESNSKYRNYTFASHFKRCCDIKGHSKVILDSKDPKYNYLFLRDVIALTDINSELFNLHKKVIFDALNSPDIKTKQEAQEIVSKFNDEFNDEKIKELFASQKSRLDEQFDEAKQVNEKINLAYKYIKHHKNAYEEIKKISN